MRYALLFMALFAAAASGPPVQALEAGAAKVEITPAVGAPLHGYGDRLGRSSTGVHDPLWARALFLDDGETQVILVNADLCVINRELRDRVLELAPANIPREHVILTATHTHNAPGAMHRHLPVRFVAGRYMPEVLESTARGIAQAMREAVDNAGRAAIGYGTSRQQVLSVNRRREGGPIDEQIGVIRVDDADGDPIAIIGNFAAHPTSVPGESRYEFSADFPGVFYEELERLSTPGMVAMFLNGAQGDQTIANPERNEGWARVESVGRLLAARVKGLANDIICTDATLRVATARPALPPTIAAEFLPETTFLQTLEINDLLLSFIPGEPVVEIGLELRRRALARGYDTQFSVGLSNDHLMYLVTRELFTEPSYEAAMNFYGPQAAEWLYAEFDQLMRGAAPTEEAAAPATAPAEEIPGGFRLRLQGTPHAMGVQRGRAFEEEIRRKYAERVVERLMARDRLPAGSMWRLWPPFLDPAPVALPMMAMAARPMLGGVSAESFRELEGLAEGAGLAFDAAWLLQNAHAFAGRQDTAVLFDTPLCTMVAAVGARAGAEGLLVGRNLDWADADAPVIAEVYPDTGHAFVQAGFAWSTGVYTGMNDAGLVVAVERVAGLGESALTGPPVEMVLRDVMQHSGSFSAGLERLRAQRHLRGYHVLLAGEEDGTPVVAVLEYGDTIVVRTAEEDGLVLGAVPGGVRLEEETHSRYTRAQQLLAPEGVITREVLARVLSDTAGERAGMHRIWNEFTRHSVIFEPRRRTAHIVLRDAAGQPAEALTLTLRRGAA